MNAGRGGRVSSNIFKDRFWFRKVEALRINELWIRMRKLLPLAHFEMAIEDVDKFREIGRQSSANDIFLTLPTNFLTDALALEHLFWN
jgi:hypothetical protein